jgi:hypothetical protein
VRHALTNCKKLHLNKTKPDPATGSLKGIGSTHRRRTRGGASTGLGFNPKPCGSAKAGQEVIDRHLSAAPIPDQEEKDGGDDGNENGGGDENDGVSGGVRRE